MWRRMIVAVMSAIMVLLMLTSFVLADAPQSAVTMQGQETRVSGARTSQIRLVLKSNDSTGWVLDMNLSVQGGEREGETEYARTSIAPAGNVRGSFLLGTSQQPISSGTVAGSLNSNGKGNLTLSDQNSATSLEMSLIIIRSGTVTATVQGNWPVIPIPPPPPAVSFVTATIPAIPAAATLDSVTGIPFTAEPQTDLTQPDDHFFWYLSRTAAIAAYLLLFMNICLGIGLKSKYLDRMWERWRVADLHQFTALLGGGLVILHIFSLLGDSYFSFSLRDLFVPMASPYRSFWVAWGIIGFYCGVVVGLSFYLRRMIGLKTWRILHYVSYMLFFAILFHGIKAGTDSSATWVQSMYICSGTVTAFLFLWRFCIYQVAKAPKGEYIRIPSPNECLRKIKSLDNLHGRA